MSKEPSSDMVRKGSCVCGDISLEVRGEPVRVAACYCDHCRVNSGGFAQLGARFPSSALIVHDPNSLLNSYTFTDTSSGNPKQKYFCRTCGSNLYAAVNVPDGEGIVSVRVPILDPKFEDKGLHPKIEGFPQNKPRFLEDLEKQSQL
ncbi:hypothetical protein M501DRAFT_1019905 [Patellaria atrata CBS 101060]|uniref:CENP-V/GFA domain-containing protein n=1 Tax=Patellaria atrata CBS 101060 TaxID=1346257 RepID=A0A9P4S578_9PEZI|nr:hypothetical protein M501DRAFT_1019905 [Patellaria atrata CBS 101060]